MLSVPELDSSVSAGTTKEHLGYALALGVPVIVVVNKVDLCPASSVERLLRQLETILKSPGCKKIPVRINSEDDAITCLLYTSPSPRDEESSRMPSSA